MHTIYWNGLSPERAFLTGTDSRQQWYPPWGGTWLPSEKLWRKRRANRLNDEQKHDIRPTVRMQIFYEKVELFSTIPLSEQIILCILKENEVVRVIEMTRDREKRNPGWIWSLHITQRRDALASQWNDHLGNVRVRYVDKDDSGERSCSSHQSDS